MNILKRDIRSPYQKEWDVLCKKEQKYLAGRKEKKETALNKLLAEKVPGKLQETLDKAFEKAFAFIFDKGIGIIEKTYKKEELEKEFKINQYTNEVRRTRKTLKKFGKNAGKAGMTNLALSGVSGVGMGLLGMGLPDIPIVTGMILKCVYEIALSFGFDYTSEAERYFVLFIIEGAVSYGEHLNEVDGKIEEFMKNPRLLEGDSLETQVSNTSKMLSKELLYMKFLQGIPVVGAIAGAYDMIYMKQISEYAKLKYQKRFLLNYRASSR